MNIEKIREIEIFSQSSPEILNRLSCILKENFYKSGEIIIKENTPGDAFYVIRTGRVKVTKIVNPESREEKILDYMSPGDFFGEMALLNDLPRSASIVAIEDSEIVSLERADFIEILNNEENVASSILLYIMKVICQRLRHQNRELVVLFEIARIISSTSDINIFSRKILDLLMWSVMADSGILVLQSQFSSDFETIYSPGFENIKEGFVINMEGFIGKVITENRLYFVEDFNNDDRFTELLKEGYESRSMYCLPISVLKDTFGAVLLCREEPSDPFKPDMEPLIIAVVNQLSWAIKNAREEEDRKAKEKLQQIYYRF